MVPVDIFVLFLILEEKQLFTIEYEVSSGFVIYGLYYVRYALYTQASQVTQW